MAHCVIKLFGKRIPLQPVEEEEEELDKTPKSPNCISNDSNSDKGSSQTDPKDSTNLSTTPSQSESPKEDEETTTTTNNNSAGTETSDEDNNNNNNNKTSPKKPDKILPCPRCHSTETKFCYFNNYNVNQPRHFCKNCQRYWTAGGSMRNVPVGAGRRKSKSNPTSALPGSHFYRNLTVPNMLLQPLERNSVSPKGNGTATVLSFGPEPNPLSINGFRVVETGDENLSVPSVGISKSKDEEKVKKIGNNGITGATVNGGTAPWPYVYGPVPAVYNGSGMGMGVQIYPYWGCIPWPNGAWTAPWSNNGALGKRSRDGSLSDSDPEKDVAVNKILVPKTLRIDNPEEAARSSVWALVSGAHSEKSHKIDKIVEGENNKIGTMFDLKGEAKDVRSVVKKPHLLIANPAALARSVNFHERA